MKNIWLPAYLVLCRLLQMVLDLNNQQFVLLFLIGTAVIFILTSLFHVHDMPADEAAQKVENKVHETIDAVTGHTAFVKPQDIMKDEQQIGPSGHRAPEGF